MAEDPPVADAGASPAAQYYAVVVPGGFEAPSLLCAPAPEQLAAVLRPLFTGPNAALCRVYAFAGTHLAVGGDPVRRLLLPDGKAVDLNADAAAEPDPTGFLLPPSARGITTQPSAKE